MNTRSRAIAATFLSLVVAGCASQSQSETDSDQPACAIDVYAKTHPYTKPSGMPSDWDPAIPIPAAATIASVGEPHGSVRSVEFSTTGESYHDLTNLYLDGLSSAGYSVDKPIEQAQQKTFNVAFTGCGRFDSVSILSRAGDPNAFDVHVVYVPPETRKPEQTVKSKVEGLAMECSFGDSDACNKIEAMKANSGGIEQGAAHDAMIHEQLKSPEQRRQDLEQSHGFYDSPSP